MITQPKDNQRLNPFFLVRSCRFVNETGVIWAVDRNSDYSVALLAVLSFFRKDYIPLKCLSVADDNCPKLSHYDTFCCFLF